MVCVLYYYVHGFVVSLKCIGTHTQNIVTAPDNILAVTGLSAVLGIVLVCVMLAVCILFISLVKRKLRNKTLSPTAQSMLVLLLCKVYNITIVSFVQNHCSPSKNYVMSIPLWKSNVFPTIGSQPATSAAVTTNPTYYEQFELQPPTTSTAGGEKEHIYEQVELKPITTQQKEIKVAPNAAYVTVQR